MTRFEKWECLEKGMSEETVLRILGKPSSKKKLEWSNQL
jgi:outer membrane protein assembly factor BamE (lipoprotein component of BamABCDE complex)